MNAINANTCSKLPTRYGHVDVRYTGDTEVASGTHCYYCQADIATLPDNVWGDARELGVNLGSDAQGWRGWAIAYACPMGSGCAQ